MRRLPALRPRPRAAASSAGVAAGRRGPFLVLLLVILLAAPSASASGAQYVGPIPGRVVAVDASGAIDGSTAYVVSGITATGNYSTTVISVDLSTGKGGVVAHLPPISDNT